MASLESQRQLLEELEVLEVATAQRFRKNPSLAPLAHIEEMDLVLESSRKRPHKETLLQQHELNFFGHQLQRNCLRAVSNFESESLKNEIAKLKDPLMKFGEFDIQLQKLTGKHRELGSRTNVESLLDLYRIYLSAPHEEMKESKTKRKYLLSSAAAHLREQVSASFNEVEMFGKFLDLSLYYDIYKKVTLSQESYVQYIQNLTNFSHSNNGEDYVRYLESLLTYLRRTFKNSHPLELLPEVEKEEKEERPQQDGTPNEKGEVYCKACNKFFTKETVFKGHLQGKKHKKNVATSNASVQLNDEVKKSNNSSAKQLEDQVKIMAKALENELIATVQDHERRSGLSDREKMLEFLAVEGEESEFTSAETDSENEQEEDNDDEFYSKDLPIGTDGTPIPLWLYKLQGLHRTYQCEICGNAVYKGRQQYTKHFSQPKHVHGLMCLGILETDVWSFSNISTIEDAQKLWKKMRKSRLEIQHNDENTVEVEDEEGNVMSHKDYVELKRQGLL